ncbi:MAG: hypothetical protein R3F62_31835 [Planctomycetota bacterium]
MLKTPTFADVIELSQPGPDPCISLYLPFDPTPQGKRKAAIRVHNAVREAQQQLERDQHGLATALEELGDDAIERGHGQGLALFVNTRRAIAFNAAIRFKELERVGQRFALIPLLEAVGSQARFHLLALSPNHVQLHEGNAQGLTPVASSIPRNMGEALGEEYFIPHLGARPQSVSHGRTNRHGHRDDNEKDVQLMRFMRAVEEAVWEELKDSDAPLILACVDRNATAFASVCRLAHLIANHVSGNADHMTLAALHERAWPLMREVFAERDRQWVAESETALGTGRATTTWQGLASAVCEGRVDTLLIGREQEVWGGYDVTTGAIELHDERRDDSVELTEALVQLALQRGAYVASFPSGELPREVPPIALLRWDTPLPEDEPVEFTPDEKQLQAALRGTFPASDPPGTWAAPPRTS